MIPQRIEVHIICSKCNKPVEERHMTHDPVAGTYTYKVSCHGAEDSGPHLVTPDGTRAHGMILKAFP